MEWMVTTCQERNAQPPAFACPVSLRSSLQVASSLQQYGCTLLQLAQRRAAANSEQATPAAAAVATEAQAAAAVAAAASAARAQAGGAAHGVSKQGGAGGAGGGEGGSDAAYAAAAAAPGSESGTAFDGQGASCWDGSQLDVQTATAAELSAEAVMALERAVR